MSGYKPMAAPDHLLAFSCKDAAEEAFMSSELRHHDIDYRRTSNDIELMTINAKNIGNQSKPRGQCNMKIIKSPTIH